MSLIRKLKPDRNIIGPLVPLSMILLFGFSTLIFGISIGMYALAGLIALFLLFYLYVFIRTRNIPHLIISIYIAYLVLVVILAAGAMNTGAFNDLEFGLFYFTGMVFFGFVIIYLALTRKLKWRGREIFELAAESVDESGSGYTSRPRPVGKIEYNLQQMHAFARFCSGKLIALPYFSSKNITLVTIKMGDEYGRFLGLSGDYRDASWVNFDVDGEVSVHISQKDYLDYRQPLAFDQLCTSLGQVFIDFFELFNKGEGIRVLDRLDDLKIGIFS